MPQYSPIQILKRLFANHIKPYTPKILLAIFIMITVALCQAANVGLAKPLLDDIFANKNKQMLVTLALIMLAVEVVKGIGEYLQSYLVKSIGQSILTDLQILLFNHLLHSDLAFLQKESCGKIISRLTNDINLMRGAVSSLLIGAARYFFTVISLIILMFSLEPKLSSIIFIIFPIAIYPVQYIGRKMRGIVNQTQDHLSQYTSKLDEVFLSIKVVKSYEGESLEAANAKKITDSILKLYKKAIRLDSFTSPITQFFSGIAIASILIYGGLQVIDGNSTPGSLMAFIAAFFSAYRPFKQLLILNVSLQEGIAAARRIFQMLDTKPTIYDSPSALPAMFSKPAIDFKNVHLTLNRKQIFTDLNLQIPAGKITAIIGPSGSGKTSIVNLLLKFYLPNSGQIIIDGQDISNYLAKSLRSQIALVTQETLLFDTSIANNIAYTTPASMEEIMLAAEKSSANEFIESLPQKYQTCIGHQGYTLSGGQRQRLALSRALLKKAPILILDEATSSLDSCNENFILASLKKHSKDITTIIITHRISTIEDIADNIIVMNKGQVSAQGTHKELIATSHIYQELYNQQKQVLTDENT